MSKGVSELATAALYVGITVTAISGAVTVGTPALENMQDAAAVSNAENFMQSLETDIQEVVSEGEGSTRTLDVDLDRGELYFDDEASALVYELETDADVISPQTSQREGNVIMSSNADVEVENTTVDEEDECYMMRNERVEACIKDLDGDETTDTSDLLVKYEFLDTGKELDAELEVMVNENEETASGNITTYPAETGSFIGTGEVVAEVRGESAFHYDVLFRLPTGADFLQVDVRET